MPSVRIAACVLACCTGWLSSAAAQLTGRAGVAVHERYIWRGIRRADGANAQLDASIGWRRGSIRVAGGLWGNAELSTHSRNQLTELRRGHWGMSEATGWLELSHQGNRNAFAAGLVWYQYHLPDDSHGTGEVYARWRGVLGRAFRVSPELGVWYDPVERNTGYAEAGLTAPILALPFRVPALLAYTSVTAGAALGHADGGPRLASSWFATSGFTHADFAAGVRLRAATGAGSLHLNLAGHLFRADDPATRRKSAVPSDVSSRLRVYLTFEAGFSWSKEPHP